MTKAELLTDLDSKTEVLEIIDSNPAPLQSKGAVNWYDIPIVLDKGNNLVNGASQPILVIDEGEASEAAYYNIKKVFSVPVEESQLKQDAKSYLDITLKKTWGSGKLLKYQIDSVNEEQAHVKATGFTDVGTEEQGIVFFDDASSEWTHQILN